MFKIKNLFLLPVSRYFFFLSWFLLFVGDLCIWISWAFLFFLSITLLGKMCTCFGWKWCLPISYWKSHVSAKRNKWKSERDAEKPELFLFSIFKMKHFAVSFWRLFENCSCIFIGKQNNLRINKLHGFWLIIWFHNQSLQCFLMCFLFFIFLYKFLFWEKE